MSQRHDQVIDGARNCRYDVCAVSEGDFALLFPAPKQDTEFVGLLCTRRR
ncbi:MAG: hypothetical protein WCJ30_16450 [Deltaproteobacteria bacterium]